MTDSNRTAIVTGASKRVGRAIAEALVAEGWTVIAHVREEDDEVPEGAISMAADLAAEDCAERIFAAADQAPPVRLLINNAARFAHDGFGAFSISEFDAHISVNLRAPILLSETFAARGEGELIVNLLDAKLAAPNPDFLSYTLSKQALAGFTELAARAYAGLGIRVNGIAPALMLKSAGQSDANFAAMHARNPLGRGVTTHDVVGALRWLIDAPSVTGQILTLDGGQRFLGLDRDVQFIDQETGE